MTPTLILVMGVAGSGKTSVGRALAGALGARFVDADDLHSAANVERMRRGIPLDDEDRAPWLRDVRAAVDRELARGSDVVLACSALKAAYREVLLGGIDRAVIILLRTDRATVERRIASRSGHYMPASLVDSQLAALEEPDDAILVEGTADLGDLVSRIRRRLGGSAPEGPTGA